MYGDPPTRAVEDAIYLPKLNTQTWGIFDSERQIVEESLDYRGRDKLLRSQDIGYPENEKPCGDRQDGAFIYCGDMNNHFGHFLVNTLPRLWSDECKTADYQLLYHGDIKTALSQSFIKTIFGALDIDTSRIRTFDKPTQIKKLLVPSSCFREQYFCYSKYGDLCRSIGERLLDGYGAEGISSTPVYFSKTKLLRGVGRFANEEVVERAAADAGFIVVYPELLSFREQLKLMSSHRLLVGCTGSVFHNEIFLKNGIDAIVLNNIPDINSNFVLLDKLSSSRIDYYCPDGMSYEHHVDGFLTESRAPDMRLVAEELIKLAKERSSRLEASHDLGRIR